MAVVISDSFGRPWRFGIVDVALGVAGIAPLDDQRGRPDADGRIMHSTIVAVADEICSAAELAAGKVSRQPVVLVRGVELGSRARARSTATWSCRASWTCSGNNPAVKVGLQISSFTWPGGDAAIGADACAHLPRPPTTPASTRSG